MANAALTPIGKLFFASLIAWIVHDTKFNWNLKGEPKQVEALVKLAFAAKRFHQEITKEGATIESVIQKLNEKNKAAEEFEQIMGFKPPL